MYLQRLGDALADGDERVRARVAAAARLGGQQRGPCRAARHARRGLSTRLLEHHQRSPRGRVEVVVPESRGVGDVGLKRPAWRVERIVRGLRARLARVPAVQPMARVHGVGQVSEPPQCLLQRERPRACHQQVHGASLAERAVAADVRSGPHGQRVRRAGLQRRGGGEGHVVAYGLPLAGEVRAQRWHRRVEGRGAGEAHAKRRRAVGDDGFGELDDLRAWGGLGRRRWACRSCAGFRRDGRRARSRRCFAGGARRRGARRDARSQDPARKAERGKACQPVSCLGAHGREA